VPEEECVGVFEIVDDAVVFGESVVVFVDVVVEVCDTETVDVFELVDVSDELNDSVPLALGLVELLLDKEGLPDIVDDVDGLAV
jgi:hypothetical protein